VRTPFAFFVLALASCSPVPEQSPEAAEPPNIVYIQSDTHRWGAMSFTQTPQVVTPNMAKLREQGVSLDRYYVNLPICTPYRAIMMTGRWPYQQGLMANHMSLGERVDMPEGKKTRGTIAWTFKDAGYTTGHFGKWHLGGRDARPFGFDRSVVWNGTNNHRKNTYNVDGGDAEPWKGESNATAITEQALDWIAQEAASKTPFFAVISLNPPHGPFDDAPEAKKKLYPDEQTLPFHPKDEIRDFEQHRDYHALISGIDDDLGMVMARLDELGIAGNTILVYTSDHGAMTGIDGVAYGQKRHPNDESARVPFLVRWPGHIPPGRDLETLASTMDVLPTLAALAGVAPKLAGKESGAYLASLEGTNLAPFLLGKAEGVAEPEAVFLSHPSNMNNNGSRHEIVWRAIVTKDFTYAVTDKGEHRLWKNGPGYQEPNLLDDPAYLRTRVELWNKLDALMDKDERPYYDQWFANAAEAEVEAWNREHGLGEDNADREAGKRAVFDMSKSKPGAGVSD
jgi:arylsulfatase A-like enzyme